MGLTIEKAAPPAGPASGTHPAHYWNADRSELVPEGDVRAAFLAYGPFDPIAPEHLSLLANQRSDEIEHDLYGSDDNVPAPVPAKSAPVKRATRKRG